MATSKSARDTFSRLGMFGERAMPRIDQILYPNARKIVEQSDKTFGNRYNIRMELEQEEHDDARVRHRNRRQ